MESEKTDRGGMTSSFVHLDYWMVGEMGLRGNDLIVFAVILGFCQDGFFHQIDNDYLSAWTLKSQPSLWRSIQRLEEKNLIFVKRRHGFFNSYAVNFTKIKEAQKKLLLDKQKREEEVRRPKANMLKDVKKEAMKEIEEENRTRQELETKEKTGMDSQQLHDLITKEDWTCHDLS